MPKQKTLQTSISANGIGLHSGKLVRITLIPAICDTGIIFRKTVATQGDIRASLDCVSATELATVLANKYGHSVSTVEHLMAALACLGISNCIVEIDGDELPIMDGSAAPFVFLLQCAGIKEQEAEQKVIKIDDGVEISDGDSWARIEPHSGFAVDVTIDYKHPYFASGVQRLSLDSSVHSFDREVCRARTYVFQRDLAQILADGKARGGSLENALLIGERGLLNSGGFRYQDELVRHKILDAIGDLQLLGYPLQAKITAYKPGHRLNHKLACAVKEQISKDHIAANLSQEKYYIDGILGVPRLNCANHPPENIIVSNPMVDTPN